MFGSPDDLEQVVDLLVHLVLYLPQGVEALPQIGVVHGGVQ